MVKIHICYDTPKEGDYLKTFIRLLEQESRLQKKGKTDNKSGRNHIYFVLKK